MMLSVWAWLSWQWAICPLWGKAVVGLLVLALVLQAIDIALRSWKVLIVAAVVLLLLGMVPGCERAAFDVPVADAAVSSSNEKIDGGIDGVSTDTESLPACGPSPITIDRDCGGFTDGGKTCMVASGLEKAPCTFQGGYLVVVCSQCWWLP